jgi:hypothetical protein
MNPLKKWRGSSILKRHEAFAKKIRVNLIQAFGSKCLALYNYDSSCCFVWMWIRLSISWKTWTEYLREKGVGKITCIHDGGSKTRRDENASWGICLFPSPNISRRITRRTIRWAGNVALVGEFWRNDTTSKTLGVDKGTILKWTLKKQNGKVRTGFIEPRVWTRQWTLGFYKRRVISWLHKEQLDSQKEICSMELIRTIISSMRPLEKKKLTCDQITTIYLLFIAI